VALVASQEFTATTSDAGGSIRGQGKPVPREITTFSHDRGVEATPLQTYLMSLKKRAAGEETFGQFL
jgi:hypothetical protein